MEIGKINTLSVLRETEISYLLTDGTDEVFLHKKEAKKAYLDGEAIDVFLYVDNIGRITASTMEPIIQKGQVGLLGVVEVKPKYGVFLYYGMVKDLLLSLDDLPSDLNKWPQVGDKLYVEMIEKNNQLFAHIIGRKQITHHYPDRPRLEDRQIVDAYVMYLLENGAVAFTEAGDEIFIHKNNYRHALHIGMLVSPKILKQNPNGEYVGSLIEQKELMLEQDALDILAYMERKGGVMPFTDKSDPEQISRVFHMSKSAFKRALGSLFKAKKIELNETETKIIK
ncbi:MAG TPA: S1-like domain-containing RNA-binding protein [Bacillota bacterium]|nr:S1-like domain-containing RNA-binding protein [Bacillota bacterium]